MESWTGKLVPSISLWVYCLRSRQDLKKKLQQAYSKAPDNWFWACLTSFGGLGGSGSRSWKLSNNKDLRDWDVLWPPGNNIPGFLWGKTCCCFFCVCETCHHLMFGVPNWSVCLPNGWVPPKKHRSRQPKNPSWFQTGCHHRDPAAWMGCLLQSFFFWRIGGRDVSHWIHDDDDDDGDDDDDDDDDDL